MKLVELTPRLQASHHHDPQACQVIQSALAEIQHGLDLLTRLGHVYHLEPGPPFDLPPWPKILFHVESAPNGRVVNSYWEAADLGPGWWPTLTEAQQREGIRAQFAGRGGIGDRSLPMLVDGGPAGPRPEPIHTPTDNSSIINDWKRSIADVRSNGEGHWGQTNILASGTETTNRNGNGIKPPEVETGPGVFGQFELGHSGPGNNGAENRVPDAGAGSPEGVPQNGLPGERLSDRGERAARAAADLRRILESSANTLSASRASRETPGTNSINSPPNPAKS